MIGFPRILSISALLAGVLVLADDAPPYVPPCSLMLVPPSLLELVPDECEGSSGNGFFEEAVCCALSSFEECFGLVGVLSDFQSIPAPSADLTCTDIQTPFCTIASTCMRCINEFKDLVECMVTYNPEILTAIASIVPTDAPSNAPTTPAPSAFPTETNSTEVDDDIVTNSTEVDDDDNLVEDAEDAEVPDLQALIDSCDLVETCESQQ